MNVSGASTNAGAPVIQFACGTKENDQWMPVPAGNGLYYFINRLSGLSLDKPAVSSGTQLDQQPYSGSPNQQFSIGVTATQPQSTFSISASPGSQVVSAGTATNYTVTLGTNAGFSGSVTFSLSGLPANATADFLPPSLSCARLILTERQHGDEYSIWHLRPDRHGEQQRRYEYSLCFPDGIFSRFEPRLEFRFKHHVGYNHSELAERIGRHE